MSTVEGGGYDDTYPEWVAGRIEGEPEEQPPLDTVYGDIVDDYDGSMLPEQTAEGELVDDMPAELAEVQPARPPMRREPEGWQSGTVKYTNGKVTHTRSFRAPLYDGKVDGYRLARGFIESVRDGAQYRGETHMNRAEQQIVDRYREAQRRVGVDLGIPGAVAYKLDSTPYRVFNTPEQLAAAVRKQLGVERRTDSRGVYEPVMGALWVRTPSVPVMETGLARLVVLSSAAVVVIPQQPKTNEAYKALPPAFRDQLERRRSNRGAIAAPQADAARQLPSTAQNQIARRDGRSGVARPQPAKTQQTGVEALFGEGYDRPDVITDSRRTRGVHSAVGDMATMRVLREGGYRGAPVLRSPAYNIVLDGVIRVAAARLREPRRDIADDLLRGYYGGQLDGLHRVQRAIGSWGTDRLMTMRSSMSFMEMGKVGDAIGAPDLEDRYRKLLSGVAVPLYRW